MQINNNLFGNILIAYVLFLSCFVGCSRSPQAGLDGRIRAPKPDDYQIDIYLTKKPTRPYTEIRYIRREMDDRMDKLMIWMKKVARESGGDAVIKMESGQWQKSTGLTGLSSEGGETFNGVVIEYDDVKNGEREQPKPIKQETAPTQPNQ